VFNSDNHGVFLQEMDDVGDKTDDSKDNEKRNIDLTYLVEKLSQHAELENTEIKRII